MIGIGNTGLGTGSWAWGWWGGKAGRLSVLILKSQGALIFCSRNLLPGECRKVREESRKRHSERSLLVPVPQ